MSTFDRAALRLPVTKNDIAVTRATTHPLEQIAVPVLVVHGTGDRLVPFTQHAKPLAARVPGAQLLAIEGGEHVAIFTHRNEVRERTASRMGWVFWVAALIGYLSRSTTHPERSARERTRKCLSVFWKPAPTAEANSARPRFPFFLDFHGLAPGQLDHHLYESLGDGAILLGQPLPRRGPYESIGQAHAVDRGTFKQFGHGDFPSCVLTFWLRHQGGVCRSVGLKDDPPLLHDLDHAVGKGGADNTATSTGELEGGELGAHEHRGAAAFVPHPGSLVVGQPAPAQVTQLP
jgi:hypothetical protein